MNKSDKENSLLNQEWGLRGVFVFDKDGCIIFCDSACYNVLGYDAGELIGKSVIEILEEVSEQASIHDLQQRLLKEESFPFPDTARCKKKNNEIIELKIEWGHLRDHQNAIIGIIATMTNLAAWKRVEVNTRTLEEVSQICLEAGHQEEMLESVLHLVLERFECDRAWLLYPCDPEAPAWSVRKEVTRAEWPGLAVEKKEMPMDETTAFFLAQSLRAYPDSMAVYPEATSGKFREVLEQFSVQSQLMVSLKPKIGKPWLMGIHYCRAPHAISREEQDLFIEIGKRVSEALSSLLSIQKLSETQKRLNEAQRIASMGSWEWNIKTGEIFWSKEMYHIFGADLKSFTPTYDYGIKFIHKDDLKRVSEHITSFFAGTETKNSIECRICLEDGSERVIKQIGEVIRDENSAPLIMMGTTQDITEKRKQVDLLHFQNEITGNMAEGISMVNSEGILVYTNSSLDQMYGYEHGELLGKHVSILNSPMGQSPQKTADEIMSALKKNRTWRGEVKNIKKDGTTFLTAASISSFEHSEFGEVWLSLQTDITEKVELEKELKRNKDNLSEAQRIAKIGSWEWDLITQEILWSDEMYRIFGVNTDSFKPTYEAYMSCVHPDDREVVSEAVKNSLNSKEVSNEVEYRIVQPGAGEVMSIGVWELFRDEKGEPVRMIGTVQDITERKLIEEKQLLSAQVVENSAEAIVVTDAENKIISVNQAYTEITGYTLEEVIGKNPKLLKSGMYDTEFYHKLWETLLKKGRWQGELVDRRKSGELFPAWQTISVLRNKQGKVINYLSLISDISSVKESQEQLQFLAYHDPLTMLPNRLLMSDRLNHAIVRAKRESHMVAILFIDLDRFKTINDSLGHPVGDVLLKQAAERIQKEVRKADTVSRHGGDEFVIILEKIENVQYAAMLARKLIKAFGEPFMVQGHELHISLSVGISIYPGDGEDNITLLRNADAAMYRAKEQGRNDYQFYTSILTTYAFERLTLETALRHALEKEELVLYYQPQYLLDTGEITGAEALIRWRHPELGVVTPDKFIPMTEESGLIVPMGEWVLRTAVYQMKEWRNKGYPLHHMAVNVSGRQFRKNEIISSLKNALEETGLNPEYIEIEITESILMQEKSHGEILNELKKLGVNITIDDFGTGYSSLSYLKQLPVQKLKIDQSFVRDIAIDPSDKAITKAVIALGQSLQLDVIAEGVETRLQQELLSSLGCKEGQGYFCSPPVPASEFEKLLQGLNQIGA